MNKKATVLLALISMCLITTAGIGAVSASDKPVGVITVGKINPDGSTTVAETFDVSGPTVVTVTKDEDGSQKVTREDRQISEDELSYDVVKEITIGPETELPVNIEEENFSLIADRADILEPSEQIDASARTLYYKAYTKNYNTGDDCWAYSYVNSYGAGAKSWDDYTQCWVWQW
ncbi:MAG: hypothetical protein WAV32_03970 [Halobacteriota archaeon]